MASVMDEQLVAEKGGRREKKLGKKSFCKRYRLLVFIITLSIASCVMSVITAVFYFKIKDGKNRDRNSEDPSNPLYSMKMNRIILNNNSTSQKHPAFAHKVLHMDLPESDSRETKQMLKIDPDHDDVKHEISHGVKLRPKGIEIIYPGSYFVYKSIYFTPQSRSDCQQNTKKFESILSSRSSRGKTKILVQSIHTCCPDCQDGTESSFSGGVFLLEEGDIIQVEVMGYNTVDVEKDVTYVGLMKLGTPL